MNIPLAFQSCGQMKTRLASAEEAGAMGSGCGSNSGCAALNASATAVVSLRVSVHTA